MLTKLLAGFVTAGFLLPPLVLAADKPQKKSPESDEIAQAIAFERQKDAAAVRQARIEARHPTVTHHNSDDERSADRDTPKSNRSGEDHTKQSK